MVTDIYYSFAYEEDERGEFVEVGKELDYKGEAIEPNSWEKVQEELNLRKLKNNFNNIISINTEDKLENVKSGIENHLSEIKCDYFNRDIDIDGDGNTETVYVVNNYAQIWIDNNIEEYSYDDNSVPFNMGFIPNDNVIIILDDNQNGTDINVKIIDINEDIIDIKIQDKIVVKTADNEYLYTYNAGEDVLLTADKRYNDDMWKQAYVDYIKEIAPKMSYMDISLVDMDDDGIAEMIISLNTNYEYSGFYTYENDKVELLSNEVTKSLECINGIYFYTSQRFAADDPLYISGVIKEENEIVQLVGCYMDYSFEGKFNVEINGSIVADTPDECIKIMSEFGIDLIVSENDWGIECDYITRDASEIGGISAMWGDETPDTEEIENFIWSY